MSGATETTDLTPLSGIDLRSLSKSKGSPFLQNVVPRNGEFMTRAGFGLVREYGTSMSCGRLNDTTTYGLGAPIGATMVRTPWGTDQILVVHPLTAFTGNLKSDAAVAELLAGRRGVVLNGAAAVVHDLATGRHAEFVLHYQDAQTDDLQSVFPNYATRFDQDLSRWAVAARTPTWAVFAPVAGNYVVAIDGMGLWTYRPVDIARLPDRKNNSLDLATLQVLAGETCAFSPLNLSDGSFVDDGLTYLTTTEMGSVDALTVMNDRVVYAVGSTLWFSDANRPDNVLVDNFLVLPTPDTVTCLAAVRGALFIATARQCWVFQPAAGDAAVTGTGSLLTLVSGAVGCANNRAYVSADAGVFFAEHTGVYLYGGGVAVKELSEEIDRLWTDPQSLQMPLTDYYVKTGRTDLTAPQLPALIDVRAQLDGARLTWHQDRNTLYCVGDDIVLCWTQGFGWHVWYMQTHAGSATQVQGAANIEKPTFCVLGDDVYLLGGADETMYTDADTDFLAVDSSCYLLKLGRGGAIDRSTCMTAAVPDTYTATLAGLWAAGDQARLTINAVQYTHTVTSADMATAYPLATIAAQVAALAVADPLYNVTSSSTGVVTLVQKVAGATAVAVSATVPSGSGTFTLVHTRTGADADLTDATLEDQREPVGGYVEFDVGLGTARPSLWVGRPVTVPAGYVAPSGQTVASESHWFPVAIGNTDRGGVATTPVSYRLHFNFDNSRWTPIVVQANPVDPDYAELDFVVPAERVGSVGPPGGYQQGTPDATHQVRVTDGAGTPTPSGPMIEIDWTGAGGAWTTAPNMNVGVVGPDVVLWIGFTYAATTTSLQLVQSVVTGNAQVDATNCQTYVWTEGRYPTEYKSLCDKQQPVDWVVKSREATSKGLQIRVRGVWLTALHLGNGTDDVVENWLYGPLNTATSTDLRDYTGQALDFTSNPPGNSEQRNILQRARLQATSNANPSLKVFGAGAKWASTADATKGNLLIDDAAVDVLGTSDGSQGVHASVMAHGTLNAPGESVRLEKIEAAVLTVGARRRWHG